MKPRGINLNILADETAATAAPDPLPRTAGSGGPLAFQLDVVSDVTS